jgi:hypothetical protein
MMFYIPHHLQVVCFWHVTCDDYIVIVYPFTVALFQTKTFTMPLASMSNVTTPQGNGGIWDTFNLKLPKIFVVSYHFMLFLTYLCTSHQPGIAHWLLKTLDFFWWG